MDITTKGTYSWDIQEDGEYFIRFDIENSTTSGILFYVYNGTVKVIAHSLSFFELGEYVFCIPCEENSSIVFEVKENPSIVDFSIYKEGRDD